MPARGEHLEPPQLPTAVAELCGDFRQGPQAALGHTFASLYVFGALAFPRPDRWLLDVDFHVLLHRCITNQERSAVRSLHGRLATKSALGGELDGYYILVEEAVRSDPPRSQVWPQTDNAWALHRAHVLAGRFFLLSGIDPRPVVRAPTWIELVEALEAELGFIRAHPEHAAYGVLNGCRVLYSFRRVTSLSRSTRQRNGRYRRCLMSGETSSRPRSASIARCRARPTCNSSSSVTLTSLPT
ncbi:hypothetical protein BH18ACT15_BH18ACT15_04780 [soil metagenome]